MIVEDNLNLTAYVQTKVDKGNLQLTIFSTDPEIPDTSEEVYLQMQAAEMIASNNLKLVREEDKQEGEERKFVRGLFYPDFVLADNLVFLLHD